MQHLALGSLVWLALLSNPLPTGEASAVTRQESSDCTIDLNLVGQMEDIVSNALMKAYSFDEARVRSFLVEARKGCADGPELLSKSALEFGLDEAKFRADVERFRHVNCDHPHAPIAELAANDANGSSTPGGLRPLTEFASNVTTHVVLHEMGHALVREFDLPVLGNEETLADAFATWYLTNHMPDRALDVLHARVSSLLFEAAEVPRNEWTVRGEHNSDARRAYQIAALAVASDRERYAPIADLVGMTDGDRSSAADYGAEIHRSWRRLLRPYWMPDGLASKETRLRSELSDTGDASLQESLERELMEALRRFDWHSQVTIAFQVGDGGAGWSRSKRAVTVNSAYMQRFVRQGEAIEKDD